MQISINKTADRDSVTAIINEAKKRGWRGAKFYFMIGLPYPDSSGDEEKGIIDFVLDLGRRTNMHFNINIGIFIPKPHTPYQWAAQLDSKAAHEKLDFIRAKLKTFGHKVSVSDPLISAIEGILSRGDERSGFMAEKAFLEGSRLDAWQEYINKEMWLEILNKNQELVNGIFSEKEKDIQLPWEVIDSGVCKRYYLSEAEKSDKCQFTEPCKKKCTHYCGVCDKQVNVIKNEDNESNNQYVNQYNFIVNENKKCFKKGDPEIYRVLFSYSKIGSAVFHGHLSLIEIFSMALNRTNLPIMYTQGFNPLLKIEFASPLSTGISAAGEIAVIDFNIYTDSNEFLIKINKNIPYGIQIEKAETFLIKSGQKKYSLSSLLWGFSYEGSNNDIEYINVKNEKNYRETVLNLNNTDGNKSLLFSLKRLSVLAKNISIKVNTIDPDIQPWASYFDVYRYLYPDIIK